MPAGTLTHPGHHTDGDYVEVGPDLIATTCVCRWTSDPIAVVRDGHGLLNEATLNQISDAWLDHVRPLATPPATQLLVCDLAERRWFLDGRPVHCGDRLVMLMPGDVWVPIRFETKAPEADTFGRDCHQTPVAYLPCGGPALRNGVWDFVQQTWFVIPPRAVLRWPEREGR